MDVFPDFDGLGGIGDLKQVIGALLTIVLIAAVLMVIVSAICWALGVLTGHVDRSVVPPESPYSREFRHLLSGYVKSRYGTT